MSGWRALVEVGTIRFLGSAAWSDDGTWTAGPVRTTDLTSVKLDRFSGAPIDNALFTTRAYIDPVFRVELRVRNRTGALNGKAVLDADLTLWDRLVEHLVRRGIVLGHGGNKGFGWFRCEQVTKGADGRG